jgi:Holliday junction resolvase RusA-like endonuclease
MARSVRDIDNGLKAILDGLQKARLINDDKQIKKLNVVMNDRDLSYGGKCQIMLKAIN